MKLPVLVGAFLLVCVAHAQRDDTGKMQQEADPTQVAAADGSVKRKGKPSMDRPVGAGKGRRGMKKGLFSGAFKDGMGPGGMDKCCHGLVYNFTRDCCPEAKNILPTPSEQLTADCNKEYPMNEQMKEFQQMLAKKLEKKGMTGEAINGPCFHYCVYKKNGWVDATTGKLVASTIKTDFTANQNQNWIPIITKTVDECIVNVSKVDKESIKLPPKVPKLQCGIENLDAALFMKCMKRGLSLGCTLPTPPSDNCAKLYKGLEQCDPYKPPGPPPGVMRMMKNKKFGKMGGMGSEKRKGKGRGKGKGPVDPGMPGDEKVIPPSLPSEPKTGGENPVAEP